MSNQSIQAQPRELTGKRVKSLRWAGEVPGVIYGPNTESVTVSMNGRELDAVLASAGGTSLVDVKLGKDTHQVLVREVQRDILRGHVLHVDFYAVDLEQTTRVDVPIVLVGTSPVVASRTGVLLHGINSVEVEGLPTDLISEITVDLEDLTEIGNTVTVGDLYVPSTLKIITDASDLVVKIDHPAAEEELVEAEEGEESMFAESVEPEVVGRGREEEEEEE